jgi:hypothetical protein
MTARWPTVVVPWLSMMKGRRGQYNVLIENGILKGYMQDKLNARLTWRQPVTAVVSLTRICRCRA